jgi:outer membrane translocation and assembly module TamA
LSWDRRDNVVDPTRGTFVTSDLEAAARSLGSEVGYFKAFFQASAFRRLDDSARAVVAARAMLGAARGFPRTVEVVDDRGEAVTEVVEDLPASQRFYAGGATTVRGFQLDRLGVDEILTPDGLSRGGNGLLVFNVEVRRAVAQVFGRSFGVVGFIDSGNVWARAKDLDLTRLRVAPGFGIRYDSPLGPLRFDIGFKTARNTYASGRRENGWEYHLSIGEAF